MKISFLVTYYNQSQYVRKSLDSILAIDLPDEWEILVGDDGSTDDTVNIVREYIEKDPVHIHLLVMPREQGKKYNPVERASNNRLTLLENCSGDCFCSLDGDDFYFDTVFVKEAISILMNDANIALVSYGYRDYINGTLEDEKLLPYKTEQYVDTEDYILKRYLHSGSGVHRKPYGKERIEYIRSKGSFDDNDIVMNSLHFGKMYYINRSIYAYRQAEISIYSSMDQLEKALLNIRGVDIGIALLGQVYEELLVERYYVSVLTVFYWRRVLNKPGINNRLRYYLDNMEKNREDISSMVVFYNQIGGEKQKKIRCIINKLENKHAKQALKLKIKYYLRGVI